MTCPHCGNQFKTTVFRSIWGEHTENRNLVMSDQINVVICPNCNRRTKVPIALMYVDINKQFAVWWEPIPDPQIDSELIEYGKMFGQGNFYQTAPRIRDWEEFKETIRKFETGILRANPIRISQQQQQAFQGAMRNMARDIKKKNRQNSGCLFSLMLLSVIFSAILFIIL
jgi:hypothetical protein